MLIMNGHRESYIPMTFMGDALYATTQTNNIRPFNQLSIFIGQGGFSKKTAMTEGLYPPYCWNMPLNAGSMVSHKKTSGVATATISMVSGRALAGESDGSVTVSGTGIIVISRSGQADGAATVSGNIYAILAASGSADGTSTATAEKNALAWCIGSADGSCSASLEPYAIGYLSGNIYVNESTATVTQIVNGVWDAQTTDHDASGSMGEAVKAAGTAGDPWTSTLPGSYTGEQAGAIIPKIQKLAKLTFYTK